MDSWLSCRFISLITFWITPFNGLNGTGTTHYDTDIFKYVPPPVFTSLLIVSSRPKPENEGSSFPLPTICHCGLQITSPQHLFNLFPLPMSSTAFLVQTIVIPRQPDRTCFLSCLPHSHLACFQSTFSIFPCWLLSEDSRANMIISYFSLYGFL